MITIASNIRVPTACDADFLQWRPGSNFGKPYSGEHPWKWVTWGRPIAVTYLCAPGSAVSAAVGRAATPPHPSAQLNSFPLYLKKGELKDRQGLPRTSPPPPRANEKCSGQCAVSLNNLSAVLNGTQAAVWLLNN